MLTTIISHVSRAGVERNRTLEQLRAVGLEPLVIESTTETPSALENRRGARRALEASANDPDGCFFCEDDIDCNQYLPEWLELARHVGVIVTMCLMKRHMHHPRIRPTLSVRRTHIRPSLSQVELGLWYGTQAIYFPQRVVRWILDYPKYFVEPMHQGVQQWTGFDLFLREHLEEPMYAAIPNPVQHRNPPKLVQRRKPPKVRQSLTYHFKPTRSPLDLKATFQRRE